MRSPYIQVLNLSAYLLALLFVVVGVIASKNDDLHLTAMSAIHILGITGIIFFLPDFLSEKLKSNHWYQTSAFWTIVILFAFTVFGLVLGSYAWVIGSASFIFSLVLFIESARKFLTTKVAIGLSILCISLFGFNLMGHYTNYVSLLPFELVKSGLVHIDLLMHSSITEGISTAGYSTSGLDGATFFKYHWASHLMFAGFKNVIGFSALQFYCFGYGILFIPLFIKVVINSAYGWFGKQPELISFLTALTFLMIYFTLDKFNASDQPFASESYLISIIFSLLLFSSILTSTSSERRSNLFLIFILIIAYVILFSKISTGLIVLAGISYAAFREYTDKIFRLKLAAGVLVILILTFLTIYPNDRAQVHESLIRRYQFIWQYSYGIFDYLMGAIIFITVIAYKEPLTNLKSLFSVFASRKYIVYEALAFMTAVGFAGGIAVSVNVNDVAYFSGTQLYFCLPILLFFSMFLMSKMKVANTAAVTFLMLFFSVSFISKPEIGISYLHHQKIRVENARPETNLYGSFLRKILALKANLNNQSACIYIEPNQSWFYTSQKPDACMYRDDIEASAVVPALTGFPMISGIPQNVLSSDYVYYGVYYHRIHRNKQATTVDEAISFAKADGFHTMVEYKVQDGAIIEIIHQL